MGSAVEASDGWAREDELDLGGPEENGDLDHRTGNGIADNDTAPVHELASAKKYPSIEAHGHDAGVEETVSIPDDTPSLHVRYLTSSLLHPQWLR